MRRRWPRWSGLTNFAVRSGLRGGQPRRDQTRGNDPPQTPALEDLMTFTIDTQGNIVRHESTAAIPEGSAAFSSEADLATLAERWPVTRLVNIWNALPGVPPVRKFTDRKTAIRRIWAALQVTTPAGPAGTPRIPAKRSSAPKPKSATAKRATT